MTLAAQHLAMQHHPQRLPDWMHRLAALIAERLDRPFAWGPNDCASFAADSVFACTGFDALAELRGHRRNARQARTREAAIGGIPAALERAGFAPVLPCLAQRGDIVMLEQGRRPVLAVCNGEDAVAPGKKGLMHAPMSRALKAWRV